METGLTNTPVSGHIMSSTMANSNGMDTFATFLNTLQERKRERNRGEVSLGSAPPSPDVLTLVLERLLREKDSAVGVDALRKDLGLSFMVLAQALDALQRDGRVIIAGTPGEETVSVTHSRGRVAT